MKWTKRLQFYGIGLGIGLVLTYMLMKNKSCDWTPGNRVVDLIKEAKISINDFRACQLECNGITKQDVFTLLNEGSVIFSESKVHGDVKEYVLKKDNNKVSFLLNVKDTTAQVNRVLDRDETCACAGKSETNYNELFHPNEMILKGLNENGFEFITENDCHQKCLGVDTTYIHDVIRKGAVLNAESYPRRKPNPIYVIGMINNNDTTRFMVEKGTKTRVLKAWNKTKVCECE